MKNTKKLSQKLFWENKSFVGLNPKIFLHKTLLDFDI